MAKILTEEDFLNAESYIPLAIKAAEARASAQSCIEPIQIKVKDEMLPPVFEENPMMKSLFGLQFLLNHYFKKLKPNENDEIILTTKEYDEWGEGSIFNTIERMKMSKNIEVRNKAFDIAADYREYYRMLGSEIASLLVAKNDLLSRFYEFFASSITPDSFANLMKQLQEAQKEIEDYEAQPKEWKKPILEEVK